MTLLETLDCIASRKSVRRYDKKDVPEEMIAELLVTGTLAPSAGNTQPWEFIVVRDKKIKKELSSAALDQEHVEEAPVLIIVCGNPEKSGMRYRERGKTLYYIQDTAACIENMLLAATDIGLGACWVGAFDEKAVSRLLYLPEKLRPMAILTVGFPVPYEDFPKTQRISIDRITWENTYGRKPGWIMEYGKEPRIKLKSLEEYTRELKERAEELKEKATKEKKKRESYTRRLIKKIKTLKKGD